MFARRLIQRLQEDDRRHAALLADALSERFVRPVLPDEASLTGQLDALSGTARETAQIQPTSEGAIGIQR